MARRPVVLVTGEGRRVGIGAGIAARLAADGWDVATTHWAAYDDRMPWARHHHDPDEVHAELRASGATTVAVEADFTRPEAPAELFDAVESALGPVTANVANPGPVDTGGMDDGLRAGVVEQNPLGGNGTSRDTANRVSFLLSEQGGWTNAQPLHSDGGRKA